jgi:chromosome segregation ATPase
MDRLSQSRQDKSDLELGKPIQDSTAGEGGKLPSDSGRPDLESASDFLRAAASLEAELSRDLDRLRTAAIVSDSASDWVEQYPDEASALVALGSQQTSEIDAKIAASNPGVQSVQLDWMEPAWHGLDSDAIGQSSATHDTARLPLQSSIHDSLLAGSTLADARTNDSESKQPPGAARLKSVVEMGQPTPKEFNMGRAPEGWTDVAANVNVPDSGEDEAAAAASRQILARLQSELQEARKELSVARQSIAHPANSSKSPNTNGGASRQELDQRALELRQRVVKAQQALDERARKLRDALSHERAKLKAYHVKLQKKAQELTAASRRQATGPDTAKERAELEARRNELAKRGTELETLEGAIRETGRAELAQRRAELEQVAKAQLVARNTQLEMRERALKEREVKLDETVNNRASQLKKEAAHWESRLGTRQKVLSEREANMEARVRERLEQVEREILQRKEDAERDVAIRTAELERDLAARKLEIEAKYKTLAEREARFEAERNARLADLEREGAARDSSLENQKRALFKREAELEQTVSTRLNELKREFADKHTELANRHENISRREAQLEHLINHRVADLRNEMTEQQAELKARSAILTRKEAEIEMLAQKRVADLKTEITREQAEYEIKKRTLYERESKLEQTIAARLAELDRQAAARRVEIEERERALMRSQADLGARVDAFERTKDSHEAQVKARAAELGEQIKAHQERIGRQEELIRAKITEALGRREAELEYLKSTLDEREKAFTAKESSLGGVRSELDERQAGLSARALELDHREHDLARQTLDLQIREHKADQRRSEIETGQRELDVARHELENRIGLADEAENTTRELKRRIDRQSTDLQKETEDLKHRQEMYASRLAELENREATLKARTDEVQTLNRDLDVEARRVAEERERLADLEERAKEIEGRRLDLDVRVATYQDREDALAARQARLDRESAEFAKVRAEVDRTRADFIIKEKDLESREAIIAARVQQAQEMESTFDGAQKELELQQQEIAKLRAFHGQKAAEVERRIAETAEQQAALEQARVDVERDRDQLAIQAESLREAHLAMRKEHDAYINEKAAFQAQTEQMEQKTSDLERLRGELVSRRGELETEAARLDRDRVALRDKERMVTEQNMALTQAQERAEEARRELTARIEDTEELRRQILAKADRMRKRKARLAEDAATVDRRVKQLHQEMDSARQERLKLTSEREAMERAMQSALADRQKLEREREEFEESRANAQDSQSALDEQKRRIADREERIGQRARQLEAYGANLKHQFADIQRQRQEWAELQGNSPAAEKAAQIMRQAEERERALRQKEESLRAHEEALSACAAEVAEAQQELDRRSRAMEAKVQELERQAEQVHHQREEVEELAARQHSAMDEVRSIAGADLAEERIKLRQREQELEAAYVARREALESEAAAREESCMHELHKKFEADAAQRIAELAHREEEIKRRGDTRMSEIERDIESRLESFEVQLRQRREAAEAELLRQRTALESEFGESRVSLQRQLEDIKRREIHLEESGSTFVAKLAAPLDKPARGYSHRRPIREKESSGTSSAPRASSDPFDDSDIQLAPSTQSVGDDPFVLEDDQLEFLNEPDASVQSNKRPLDDSEAEIIVRVAKRVRPRGSVFRAVSTGVILGGIVAIAYLYSRPTDMTVRGRVHVIAGGHNDEALQQNVLGEASLATGQDFKQLFRDKRLVITDCPTGDCVDISVIAPVAKRDAAQGWVDAVGKAYTAALAQIASPEDDTQKRISDLEAEQAPIIEKIKSGKQEMQSLESALANDPRTSGLEAARTRKAEVKEQLTTATSEVEDAKTALADFEKQPLPSGPAVPTDDQLREVLDKDDEIVQAMNQQQSKAIEFQAVLKTAMNKAHAPIPELTASIETMVAETQRQITAQTDKDIRDELEKIAAELADYREQAVTFCQNWDDLAPRIESWKGGADPKLLLEYQEKAEKLIRDFHTASRTSFGQAAKRADEIAAGGSEMTKRRIIQSVLKSLALSALKARNAWTIAARDVVPQYNVELKAMRQAIQDLAPRIDESRAAHKQKLAATLGQQRVQDHQSQLLKLRDQVEAAHRSHQQLSDEFMKMDTASTLDETAAGEIQKQHDLIETRKGEIAALENRAGQLQAEIEKLEKSHQGHSAESVSYAALDPIRPAIFDFKKKDVAGGIGLLFFFVITSGMLLFTPRKAAEPA